MPRKRVLQFFILLGTAISGFLIWQHVDYMMTGRISMGLCSVGKVFDCQAIEESEFSSVFGIPTAAFGFLYFLGFFLFSVRSGSSAATPNQPDIAAGRFWNITALISLIGLLTSLMLASVSAFVIRGFCLGCTLVYVTTLVIAITAMKSGFTEYLASCFGALKDLAAIFVETFGDEPVLGAEATRKILFGFLFVVSPMTMWLPHYYATRNLIANTIQKYDASPAVELQIHDSSLVEGPADAPLQIVVFTDFDCPSCKGFAPVLSSVLEMFAGKYRIIYKHYPLGKCNPIMKDQGAFHANACRLAEMAQALGALGRFATVGGELYQMQGQKELYPSLKAIAEHHGIIYLDWVREAENPETRKRVDADIVEGFKLGLTSVPAVFVNGRVVRSLQRDSVGFVLKHALEKAEASAPATVPAPDPMHMHH